MARCPQCNRFVSYDEQEPELNVHNLKPDGTLEVDVRVILNCADCSTELKEYNETLSFNLADAFDMQAVPAYGWGDFELFGRRYNAVRAVSPEAGPLLILHRYDKERRPQPRRNSLDREPPPEPIYDDVLHFLSITYGSPEELLREWVLDKCRSDRFDLQESGDFTSRYEGSGRYMKTFYGADVTLTVKDEFTGQVHVFSDSVEEAAGAFDEC